MRNLLYGIAQMYPPKSKWSVDDMPDLTGKVAMVTGTFTQTVFSSRRILVVLIISHCFGNRRGEQWDRKGNSEGGPHSSVISPSFRTAE